LLLLNRGLPEIDVAGDEAFWLAVRGNLATLHEARVWWEYLRPAINPGDRGANGHKCGGGIIAGGRAEQRGLVSLDKIHRGRDRGKGKSAVHAPSSGPDRA
jgi:hypothetical protein